MKSTLDCHLGKLELCAGSKNSYIWTLRQFILLMVTLLKILYHRVAQQQKMKG